MQRWTLAGALIVAVAARGAYADEREDWSVHAQSTYVYQLKPAFHAAYSGPNSLRAERERSYTVSATAFLGFRPWANGEIYVNPEAVQGVPLSNVTGLGGPTNGEIQKSLGADIKFYRARLFLRQTWGLGGERENVEPDANQLAGSVESHRLVLTAGNLSTIDVFTHNAYAGDARTQFLNWSFLTHGAFDYAADLRGYTWGAALEYHRDEWSLRIGRFMQPRESNGMQLNTRIFQSYGDQLEIERRHKVSGREGSVQLLAFRNVARMGSFGDALAAAQAGTPDISAVRRRQSKNGVGVAFEQDAASDVGVFARAAMNDGRTETYAFTEIDRSLSAGALVKGTHWRRAEDTLGLAVAMNALSRAHRSYLAAGGTTFFLGDGALNYRPEAIFETFYSIAVTRFGALTLDWQHIRNPGYNADRGPVNVGSLRLHAEF